MMSAGIFALSTFWILYAVCQGRDAFLSLRLIIHYYVSIISYSITLFCHDDDKFRVIQQHLWTRRCRLRDSLSVGVNVRRAPTRVSLRPSEFDWFPDRDKRRIRRRGKSRLTGRQSSITMRRSRVHSQHSKLRTFCFADQLNPIPKRIRNPCDVVSCRRNTGKSTQYGCYI